MANKKTTKKQTKKSVKTKAKKKDNIKNIIIIVLAIISFILIVSITSMLIINKNTIRCNKTITNDSYKEVSKLKIKYNENEIKNIENTRKISLLNDKDSKYLYMLNSPLEMLYKDKKVDYKIDIKKKDILIKLNYSEKQSYILDNLSIELQDIGISYDVIEDDLDGKYASFNLSKNYTKKDIISILKKAKYTCK